MGTEDTVALLYPNRKVAHSFLLVPDSGEEIVTVLYESVIENPGLQTASKDDNRQTMFSETSATSVSQTASVADSQLSRGRGENFIYKWLFILTAFVATAAIGVLFVRRKRSLADGFKIIEDKKK